MREFITNLLTFALMPFDFACKLFNSLFELIWFGSESEILDDDFKEVENKIPPFNHGGIVDASKPSKEDRFEF